MTANDALTLEGRVGEGGVWPLAWQLLRTSQCLQLCSLSGPGLLIPQHPHRPAPLFQVSESVAIGKSLPDTSSRRCSLLPWLALSFSMQTLALSYIDLWSSHLSPHLSSERTDPRAVSSTGLVSLLRGFCPFSTSRTWNNCIPKCPKGLLCVKKVGGYGGEANFL